MTAQEQAELYQKEVANLPSATLRTFDTPERDQYWQWLVDNVGFGGLASYLEIGSNCGHSLWMTSPFLCQHAHVIAVDLGTGKSGQPQACKAVCDAVGAFFLQGKSAQLAKIVVQSFGPFDLALIDADHSYEGVKADWEAYRSAVKPGGYVVFHDTRAKSMGVHQLWNEIRGGFADVWELGNRQGIGIGRMPE